MQHSVVSICQLAKIKNEGILLPSEQIFEFKKMMLHGVYYAIL